MEQVGKEISKYDFKKSTSRKVLFSKRGSEYQLKEYCPAVFRNIQELENIDFDEYMETICGDELLTRILSVGKCGTVLFSPNNLVSIKILRKEEKKIVLEILPNFYRHLKTNKASLLCKLYGLHHVRPKNGGAKVYFVAMSNKMKSNLKLHNVFDLKGATGRSNLKLVSGSFVQKDDEFDFCFYIDPLIHCRLLQQIKYDCEFLEAGGIMDYSLMLGIHIVAQHEGLKQLYELQVYNLHHRARADTNILIVGLHKLKRPIGVGSFSSDSSSTIGSFSSDMMSVASSDTDFTLSNLYSESESTFVGLFGIDMPALAVQTIKTTDESGSKREYYYDVVLYFAIVDIFQNYNMLKLMESAYKMLHKRSKSIVPIKPSAYSSRFQKFIKRVFRSGDSFIAHSDDESMSSSSSRHSG